MRTNFLASLREVLRHEGGYTNNPKDAGGATNKGITQAVYDSYRRRRGLAVRPVRYLTDGELSLIYRQLYWDKIEGDALPKGIDFAVFDAAVNSGPGRAELWLQQAVNQVAGHDILTEDGNIGTLTLDAVDDYPAAKVIEAMINLRLGFMTVAKNSKTGALLWPTFGEGWSSRLLGYRPNPRMPRAPDGVLAVATAMSVPAVFAMDVPLPPITAVVSTSSVAARPVVEASPAKPFLSWLGAVLRNQPA